MDFAHEVGERDGRPWRAVAVGVVAAAALAVTSASGWWDQGMGSTSERPSDVVTVAVTRAAGEMPARPGPPVPSGIAPWAPATVDATVGDDGYPNAWAAGNEAVRRWLAEHRDGASGPG